LFLSKARPDLASLLSWRRRRGLANRESHHRFRRMDFRDRGAGDFPVIRH